MAACWAIQKSAVIIWCPAVVYEYYSMAVRERAREKKAFLCDSTTTVYYCTVCVERGKKLIKKTTHARERMAQPRYRWTRTCRLTGRVQEVRARLREAEAAPTRRRGARGCAMSSAGCGCCGTCTRYCRRGSAALSLHELLDGPGRGCATGLCTRALLDALPDEAKIRF